MDDTVVDSDRKAKGQHAMKWGLLSVILVCCATLALTPTVGASTVVTLTRTVLGNGMYTPGYYLDIKIDLNVTGDGTVTAVGLKETLPAGWSYISLTPKADPYVLPNPGATGTLDFAWFPTPSLPLSFSYRISVPANASGQQTISGVGVCRVSEIGEVDSPVVTTDIPQNVSIQYLLTTSVVGGHGTLAPASGLQDANAVVTLTATPSTGYEVKAWTGTDNNALTTATNTVTMTSPKTVTVEFKPIQYMLTTSVVGGHGTLAPASGLQNANAVVTLTATPNTGYEVNTWEGTDDDMLTTATNTVTMTGPKTITVEFACSGIPSPPPNVQASDGSFEDKVRVTWEAVSGATEYELWRSDTNTSSAATRLGSSSETYYDDTTAAAPDVTEGSGCRPTTETSYRYYYYWVKSKSNCAESDLSISNEGHRGTDSTRKVYEKFLPNIKGVDSCALIDAGSVLSVRLYGDEPIDASTIWGVVRASGIETQNVTWLPTENVLAHDGWVVYRPEQPWPAGDHVTMTVGAQMMSGEPIGPVTYECRVMTEEEQAVAAAKNCATVWQPSYDDIDTTGLDLMAESNMEAAVAESLNGGAPLLPNGVGPMFAIGPDVVFEMPQRVWLPVPQGVTMDDAQLYYYHAGDDDGGWYPAENVEGWLVPESYLEIELGGTTYIGLLVRHVGVVQFGLREEAGLLDTVNAGLVSAGGSIQNYTGTILLMLLVAIILTLSGMPVKRWPSFEYSPVPGSD